MLKDELITILKERFLKNKERHKNISWEDIEGKLNDSILEGLLYMEETGGEPDVVEYKEKIFFWDFSIETPSGRCGFCYDKDARINRKKNAPEMSALEVAEKHNVKLLSEEEYMFLQSIKAVDKKTSSWILTEKEFREEGGAIFGTNRFNRTFIYCNGADAYYSSRGFRGSIEFYQQNSK